VSYLEIHLGVDRWGVLFRSVGKTWVLEFNREGERITMGFRKQRMIPSVQRSLSSLCSAVEILGKAQWRPAAVAELPAAHNCP
jgi:hypothetical protein